MKSLHSVAIVLGLSALTAAVPLQAVRPQSPNQNQVERAAEMSAAARAWLDSLPSDLLAKAQLPFEGAARRDWGYVPRERAGVALGELDGNQRVLVDRLLRAGLSQQGYLKAHGVITLEEVLGRDPGLYFTTVFGHPAEDAPWSWRFEGHHLSLNFTVQNGKFVSATPLFFGADPAEVREGMHAGLALFYDEEQSARELAKTFSGPVAKTAFREEDPPQDVFLSPGNDAFFEKAQGVAIGKLKPVYGGQMMQLLGLFTGNLHPSLGLPMQNRYRTHDLNDIGFLWIGKPEALSGEGDVGFYFRLSSNNEDKNFVLEYLNRGNHVHCVLRDATEDFGERQIDAWK